LGIRAWFSFNQAHMRKMFRIMGELTKKLYAILQPMHAYFWLDWPFHDHRLLSNLSLHEKDTLENQFDWKTRIYIGHQDSILKNLV
jgi:hypothetical protein